MNTKNITDSDGKRRGSVIMNKRRFPIIDKVDLRLMTELEADANQTYKDLALKLGISRPTIASKIRRLLDSEVIKIICWANPLALGYKVATGLLITAQPGKISEAASALAAYPQVSHVLLITGRFDIMAWAQFREREEFSDFLVNELGKVPGILHVETQLTLNQIMVSPRFLKEKKEPTYFDNVPIEIDDLDFKLIKELQKHARQSSVHLAQKFGVSDTTILRRVQRLEDENIIQIRTLVHPFSLGYEGVATIGLKCEMDKIKKAAQAIAAYKNVQYVFISSGRYDICAWVVFRNLNDLWNFIDVELSNISGLRDADTMINHKIVKNATPYPL